MNLTVEPWITKIHCPSFMVVQPDVKELLISVGALNSRAEGFGGLPENIEGTMHTFNNKAIKHLYMARFSSNHTKQRCSGQNRKRKTMQIPMQP